LRIVSFAWTVDTLLEGRKTVTRRLWKWKYAERFKKGEECLAYSKSPRAKGYPIAIIKLRCKPYRERLSDMPESDVKKEGGYWKNKAQFISECFQGKWHLEPWVIRFEVVKYI